MARLTVKHWMGLAAAMVLLLAGVGVGVRSTYSRAQAAPHESYDLALTGLWVGGEKADFAALAKLPPAQIVAAMKSMKGRPFYAEARIFHAGQGNMRGTTPAGTYYCVGAIIADFDSPTPKLTIAHEIWAITGKGEINTLGLETVFGAPPGFELMFSVASGTGSYMMAGQMMGQYHRWEVDPDGKPFSGDEFVRATFMGS